MQKALKAPKQVRVKEEPIEERIGKRKVDPAKKSAKVSPSKPKRRFRKGTVALR